MMDPVDMVKAISGKKEEDDFSLAEDGGNDD
jgi:hypothetical protein